jgi:very-short-patch-repair endonuclease
MPVKNIIPGQWVTKEKLQRARELRREMTPAEKLLWHELRANKLGVHFRRQKIIAGFIVDFYCHKAALVIEVDGAIHDLQQEFGFDVTSKRHHHSGRHWSGNMIYLQGQANMQ